jgi:hypothetical protein
MAAVETSTAPKEEYDGPVNTETLRSIIVKIRTNGLRNEDLKNRAKIHTLQDILKLMDMCGLIM